jgi:hypothetical protein
MKQITNFQINQGCPKFLKYKLKVKNSRSLYVLFRIVIKIRKNKLKRKFFLHYCPWIQTPNSESGSTKVIILLIQSGSVSTNLDNRISQKYCGS